MVCFFVFFLIPSVPQICGLAASRAGRGPCVFRMGGLCECTWRVGGAGCQSLSCLRSGGTGLTTPHWTDRYAFFGPCGMARESIPPSAMHTQFTQELYVVHTPCSESRAFPIISNWILQHIHFCKLLPQIAACLSSRSYKVLQLC